MLVVPVTTPFLSYHFVKAVVNDDSGQKAGGLIRVGLLVFVKGKIIPLSGGKQNSCVETKLTERPVHGGDKD